MVSHILIHVVLIIVFVLTYENYELFPTLVLFF